MEQVGSTTPPHNAADEQARYDALRAENYALLGALLVAAPSAELLGQLAVVEPDDADGGTLDAAWHGLTVAAAEADPQALDEEYQELFIGIGRGELVPFGSFYMTGFLMEKPLTVLRDDLATLGFARRDGVNEPEDHIGALCEVMAVLVGDPEHAADYSVQRNFFNTHLGPFLARFWRDLEQAKTARFYRVVGRLGAAFTELEAKYFSLPE